MFSRTNQVKIRPLKWMNASDLSDKAREDHSKMKFDYVAYHAYARKL